MTETCEIAKLSYVKKAYEKYMGKKTISDKITAGFIPFALALSKKEFYSQQDLSDYLGCNKAHTSRTLLKMQLNGLINHVCSKNEKNAITLTEKGKQFSERAQKKKESFLNCLLKDIENTDLKTFEKVLNQIIYNAQLATETK